MQNEDRDDGLLGFDEDAPSKSDWMESRKLTELSDAHVRDLVANTDDSGKLTYKVSQSAIQDVINELKYVNGDKAKPSKKTKADLKNWVTEINQWGNFIPDVVNTYVDNYYDIDSERVYNNSLGTYVLEYRKPEYCTSKLQTLISRSPVLSQCIRAMVSNVVGNGFNIGYRENIVNKKDAEKSPEVIAEKAYLKTLTDQINQELSLFDLLQRIAEDYYNFGYFFLAVRRNPRNLKEIIELIHVPAPHVKVLKREDEQIDSSELVRGTRKIPTQTRRTYKRYVMAKPVYKGSDMQLMQELEFFVELGSRKLVDARTGLELPDNLKGSPLAAMELFHGRNYDPTSSYGKPVWLSQLSAIVGQIEADSINLTNFTQNMIPQLLFLVSNMAMARNDLVGLENALNSSKRKDATKRNKAMVLRAVTSNPRIVDPEHANVRDASMNVIKLNDAENKELLFGGYDKQCADRIRSSFRLPPIIVGLTDDYNRATSVTSLRVAEQQVFALERKLFEDILNNKLLTDQNGEIFKNVKVVLTVSSIENKEDEAIFLETMSKVGALTPNMALTEFNKYTGNDYELFPEDWANRPIALSELMLQQSFSAAGKGISYDPMTGAVKSTGDPEVGKAKGLDNNAKLG